MRKLGLVVALASVALFFVGIAIDHHVLRLATKPWPVVVLALWVWREARPSRYRRFVTLGLAASLVGDMLLELAPVALFVPGLLAFLVAHVLYVLAYTSDTRVLAPLRAVPAYAYGAALIALLWPGLGPMAAPVGIYALVICTMLWRAAARVGTADPISARLALIGAVVFALSDSMIALGAFGRHLTEAHGVDLHGSAALSFAIMTTYWLGQLGIGASVFRASSHDRIH